jgi:hypothetical protein
VSAYTTVPSIAAPAAVIERRSDGRGLYVFDGTLAASTRRCSEPAADARANTIMDDLDLDLELRIGIAVHALSKTETSGPVTPVQPTSNPMRFRTACSSDGLVSPCARLRRTAAATAVVPTDRPPLDWRTTFSTPTRLSATPPSADKVAAPHDRQIVQFGANSDAT